MKLRFEPRLQGIGLRSDGRLMWAYLIGLPEKKTRTTEWKAHLKALERGEPAEPLTQAIARIGNRNAIPGLVAVLIQRYQAGSRIWSTIDKEQYWDAQCPDRPYMDSQNEQRTRAMAAAYSDGHACLRALTELGAVEELRRLSVDPALREHWRDFQSALERAQGVDVQRR
jgi:hypothetical protein